jgi:hypothetical protein
MRRTRHTDVVEFVHLFFLSEPSPFPQFKSPLAPLFLSGE